MKNPKVSVIMPSYNKADYISFSIESILNQTMNDFELIIIDDCSSDDSVKVIKSFSDERIRFYQNEENIGMAVNRNKGLKLARGEYVALQDADDISPLNRLEHESGFLDANPDIDVVYGGCQEIDVKGNNGSLYMSTLHNAQFVRAMLCWKCVISNGSTMYRKDTALSNGIMYKDNMLGMDDYMFWVEMSAVGKIKGIPETMLYWRNYNGNTTGKFLADEKRKDIYSQIQRKALVLNGFELNEQEYSIYTDVLVERPEVSVDQSNIKDFYRIIVKLIKQSKEKNMGSEWETMLKKAFAWVTEYSYIWDGC